jgi:phage gpG-like protein
MSPAEFSDLLRTVSGRVGSSKPAYAAITDLMVSSAQQNFTAQGRPTPWKPNSPVVQRLKAKHGWTKILIRSGALRRSIVASIANLDNKATIGSNLVYAQVQNDGGEIEIPEREVTLIHNYHLKSGKLLGFASRKEAMKERSGKARVGYIERAFKIPAHKISIPARPFMVFQEGERERYTSILCKFWMTGEVRR